MSESKVSIIIPCYNGEKTIERCVSSVLHQSWNNIELIFVNDGSTDKSEEKYYELEIKIISRGYSSVYVYQDNKGLGGAIDTGLKKVTGEYLCWFDVDDFLLPDSIKIRAEFLDKNKQFGSVSSDAYCYSENDLVHPKGKESDGCDDLNNPDYFYNFLTRKGFYCAGCHMVRTDVLFEMLPDRSIYPYRNGQNNQMLLPVYYKAKHAYIDIPLYGYVIADDSMSHTVRPLENRMSIEREYHQMMRITLSRIKMPIKERIVCNRIVDAWFYRQMIYLYCEKRDVVHMIQCFVMMVINRDWKGEDTRWLKELILKKR